MSGTVLHDSPKIANTSTGRMVVMTAVVVAGVYIALDRAMSNLTNVSVIVDEIIEATVLGMTAAAVLWLGVIRPLRREADRERESTAEREELLRLDAARQEFQARLHRALEMAPTEEDAYRATAKALRSGVGHLDAEVLLADSSDAHLKRAVAVGADDSRACCDVAAPRDCPAIRRAQTLTFDSSDDLDACPNLEDRPGGSCAAVCVPVSVGGRSIGVLHAATDPSSPPSVADVARLEVVATQAGSRMGMLRVMAATHLQAATDPLTGLLNRRSFENQAQDLLRRHVRLTRFHGQLGYAARPSPRR